MRRLYHLGPDGSVYFLTPRYNLLTFNPKTRRHHGLTFDRSALSAQDANDRIAERGQEHNTLPHSSTPATEPQWGFSYYTCPWLPLTHARNQNWWLKISSIQPAPTQVPLWTADVPANSIDRGTNPCAVTRLDTWTTKFISRWYKHREGKAVTSSPWISLLKFGIFTFRSPFPNFSPLFSLHFIHSISPIPCFGPDSSVM